MKKVYDSMLINTSKRNMDWLILCEKPLLFDIVSLFDDNIKPIYVYTSVNVTDYNEDKPYVENIQRAVKECSFENIVLNSYANEYHKELDNEEILFGIDFGLSHFDDKVLSSSILNKYKINNQYIFKYDRKMPIPFPKV